MNARTARLLARVARAHYLADPRDPRQPEASVLAQLKDSWNATPPAKRDETRRMLVNTFHQLIENKQ